MIGWMKKTKRPAPSISPLQPTPSGDPRPSMPWIHLEEGQPKKPAPKGRPQPSQEETHMVRHLQLGHG
ncbi:hypothetical protein N9L68_09050 [bacterium]|nr:hypothetical protein [bacterium]